MEEYFAWQIRFLEALPEVLRGNLFFRPHPFDFGHDLRKGLSDRYPFLHWDDRPSFAQSLSRARLLVIDHLGTPMLEALAADVPTLLFWHPQRWEVREEAQPHFDRLRQAGILLDNPEEAAARAAEIAMRPGPWWRSPEVQETRREFVHRYALRHPQWAKVWAEVLQPLM